MKTLIAIVLLLAPVAAGQDKALLDRAGKGDAAAHDGLGHIYSQGQGVPQDFTKAVRWWRKAADQGHADAQHNLGLMYANGQGVPQDYTVAHMWLNLAASRERNGEMQKIIAQMRELVANKMTSQQIAEAQRRAREWKPKSSVGKAEGR